MSHKLCDSSRLICNVSVNDKTVCYCIKQILLNLGDFTVYNIVLSICYGGYKLGLQILNLLGLNLKLRHSFISTIKVLSKKTKKTSALNIQ